MNRKELVYIVSAKLNISDKKARMAINAFLDSIMDALKNDDNVEIRGFGAFKTVFHRPKEVKLRTFRGRIPGRMAVKFKPFNELKKVVNRGTA